MVINESFSEGNTFIHRLDPRIRLLSAFAFSIIISVASSFQALIPALVIAFILLVLARLPFKGLLFRLLAANLFIFLFWLFIPFSVAGDVVFSIGPLELTKQGVLYCTLLTLKSNAIILILMSLAATMPVFTMGRAMNYLGVPSKLVQLFIFSYRYIHTIYREFFRLKDALDIRGFIPKTNMHTYRTYAYLIGMLIVKSHERAERVHAAMLCRGFNGKFFDLTEFSIKKNDLIFLVLFSLYLLIIILLQWQKLIFT